MKFMFLCAALAVTTPAVAGWAHHGVDWYESHPSVRDEMLAACQNDPGDAKNTPDCENALQAGFAEPSLGPDKPAYWLIYPGQLRWQLLACRPPVGPYCAAALTAAGQIERARGLKR